MSKSDDSIACPELILEGQAYKLLSEWWGTRQPLKATATGCQCEVTIIIRPLGIPIVGTIGDAPLTACEQDVLELLAANNRRMKLQEILDELGDTHADSTIAKALARLVRMNKLDHPPKSRDGYALIET